MIERDEAPEASFQQAVAAIDAGDVTTLRRLLRACPELAGYRLDVDGESYFRKPFLLWFVAENPVRNGVLPSNIGEVARVIVQAARRHRVGALWEQLDRALALVCSGRVARECGVQAELIEVLVEAGADPQNALMAALAHRELDAAEWLLERGARMTLTAAVCTRRRSEIERLAADASEEERRVAVIAAALYGDAASLEQLIELGADVDGFGPPGFHPHATALHQAVDSGSLAAVEVLVEAGAALETSDRAHGGTPLEWAEHLGRPEIAAYLRKARETR